MYANGNALGGNTHQTIQIYTAADVSFDTVAGTTYQIQEVTSLSERMAKCGSPIVAGNNRRSMSYLTPTAGNVQQFFRVWFKRHRRSGLCGDRLIHLAAGRRERQRGQPPKSSE